jgi:hypothetical protein
MKTNSITKEDIINVGKALDITTTDEQINYILENYDIEEASDPTATFDLIIENLIYQSSDYKKEKIRKLTRDLLEESHLDMLKKVDRLLNSKCIDIDSWNEHSNFMILPKSMAIAILKNESDQYSAKGTRYEKEVKENVKNFEYFL